MAADPESATGELFAPSPHDGPLDRREFGSALGRALDMLETVLETDGSLGMQEICTRLDLPRQSAHRILNQLLDLKLLQRHVAREQFTIGPRLKVLSLKASFSSHRTGPWHVLLQDLAMKTRETCHLGILDQDRVLLIDRIESEFALRVNSEIGRRLEPHSSSIGKLLMAHLPRARRQALLQNAMPLKQYTPYTLTDLDALEKDFTQIRRRGFSYSDQGTMLGMFSLAAPVKDAQGRVMAGVGVQAPFVRTTLERGLEEFAPTLMDCAARMSALLQQEEAEAAAKPV
ncbi:IclR family transcriptional regulator [Arvimicrobium flavum]|uniref:IclR family transcriptional regulator n=1 Tax=Arvimicrobium flavum TaxID=3393320 RepID=UPI00237ADDDE|nr:IclR family transcriptional regulator [Mesorhizobium shangrilense]